MTKRISPVRRGDLTGAIASVRAPMTAFTTRLCAIATVNPPGDRYVECAEFLARRLDRLGMRARLAAGRADIREWQVLASGAAVGPGGGLVEGVEDALVRLVGLGGGGGRGG